MSETNNSSNHSIIINARKSVSVTGVNDVLSFDEQTVVAETGMGQLTVKGEGLKVNNFAVETGSLSIEGKIIALGYTEPMGKKSFIGRLFG